MNHHFLRIWGVAILIGMLTVFGLLSALIGDGIWDVLSALALGVPVAVSIWFGWIKRSVSRQTSKKEKSA